ncbi:MAG: zinc ribbon domain-containing protein [Homoserinimonas sp.]
MNCTHCGTLLPTGALFCGECGRSVASASKEPLRAKPGSLPRPAGQRGPARWVEDPLTGSELTDEPTDTAVAGADADEIDIETGQDGVRCEQCQGVMGTDDIFCGECGFVSRSITRAFASAFTGETRQLDLSARIPLQEAPAGPDEDPIPEPPPSAPKGRTPAKDPVRDELVLPAAQVRRAAPPTVPAPPASPTRIQRSFLDDDGDAEDLEATRIVSRIAGNRFVLQFSTGESVTVHGTGLIGRNPQSEPGEFFDQLVRVLDSGKSVSKTHLEFGQEGGAFWLKDRFSGNGTIIREPDIAARRAEPDRRYRVVRGTRIDIGEQFFVIS